MLNLSEYLTEAENAPLGYPNLYKPKVVWKIKEDDKLDPRNVGYLAVSFPFPKNLKWQQLGFNLVVKIMAGGSTLVFLSEEDAKTFLKVIKSYPGLSGYSLSVARGRGGDELVRINTKMSIPMYMSKSTLKWLSDLPDTKVPQELRDRLDGEVEVSQDQKEKEERQAIQKQKDEDFNKKVLDAVKILDPTNLLKNESKSVLVETYMFKYRDANVVIAKLFGEPRLTLTTVSVDVPFEDSKLADSLRKILVPEDEDRRKLDYRIDNYVGLFDLNHSHSIKILPLILWSNWDVDRLVKEIKAYLDNIIDTVKSFFGTEEVLDFE